MVGGLILQNCLSNNDVKKVTIIVRKSLGLKHPKLTEIIHQNFTDYSKIINHLKGIDVCYFAIGVYTGTVPKEEFKIITVTIPVALAEVLKVYSSQTTFCFLSGQGADSSEKSKVLFAREKGIAENKIIALNFKETYIFRPGYIYPVTPRKEPNLAYKIFRLLYKPLAFLMPNSVTTSKQLAQKIVSVGLNGGNQIIFENTDIIKND